MTGSETPPTLMPTIQAKAAIGSLLGIPPSSIRCSALVAIDNEGTVHVSGPDLLSPAGKRRIAKFLDDAADVLRERAK